MQLHNKIDRRTLKKRLFEEKFERFTISFYRYIYIDDPKAFRDKLYRDWDEMNCLGRIYIAREGINAQMSIHEPFREAFFDQLERYDYLKNMPIKYAIEDDGKSFYKLTIKVRPKILADGLDDTSYDVTDVGKHLSALEFHYAIEDEKSIVVDVRNHYESEVGHFTNAILPEANTFREEIRMLPELLKEKKEDKVLLYCTGGIRCEKASAYLKSHGFKNVNQLHGGIIEYVRQVKKLNLESKFIGKNFVFDERLGEQVDGKIISQCHQCGNKSNTHTNCANDDCHLLFIQCDTCRQKYKGCCSQDCKEILEQPKGMKTYFRSKNRKKYAESKIFNGRFKAGLKLEKAILKEDKAG